MSASDDLHSKILSHGPSSDTLFILLSRMKKEGELRKVIQACVRALDMYPSDIRIRKLLAEAFLETGFLSQAEEEMQKVTRQITELATIYKRKAEVLAKQQRSKEALEAAQTYLAHYPDDQDALRLLEVVSPPISPEEDTEQEILQEPAEARILPDQTGPVPETSSGGEESREVLQERQDIMEAPAEPVSGDAERAGGREREKTEKVISTLESWLEDIREMAKPVS